MLASKRSDASSQILSEGKRIHEFQKATEIEYSG